MASFDIAYKKVEENEGGFAILSDGSIYTYCGITYKDNPTWAGWKYLLPIIRSKGIKTGTIYATGPLPALVKEFYRQEFWIKIVGGDGILNQDIANMCMDWAVNSKYNAVNLVKTIAVDSISEAAQSVVRTTLRANKYSLHPDVINVLNTQQVPAYKAVFAARKKYYDALSRSPYYSVWINRLYSFPKDTASTIKPPVVVPKPAAPAPKPASSSGSFWSFLNIFNWF